MPFDGTNFLRKTNRFTKLRQSLFAPPPPMEIRILKLARRKIWRERNWVQNTLTKPERFRTRRCAVGAIDYASLTLHATKEESFKAKCLLRAVSRLRGFETIEHMNDRSSHKQVVEAFNEALV